MYLIVIIMENVTVTYVVSSQSEIYRYLAYFVGSIIMLSNFLVVVSSGLIIKKGKHSLLLIQFNKVKFPTFPGMLESFRKIKIIINI